MKTNMVRKCVIFNSNKINVKMNNIVWLKTYNCVSNIWNLALVIYLIEILDIWLPCAERKFCKMPLLLNSNLIGNTERSILDINRHSNNMWHHRKDWQSFTKTFLAFLNHFICYWRKKALIDSKIRVKRSFLSNPIKIT